MLLLGAGALYYAVAIVRSQFPEAIQG